MMTEPGTCTWQSKASVPQFFLFEKSSQIISPIIVNLFVGLEFIIGTEADAHIQVRLVAVQSNSFNVYNCCPGSGPTRQCTIALGTVIIMVSQTMRVYRLRSEPSCSSSPSYCDSNVP
eukprot:300891-Chlamydomonas_euryale.AAC.4